MSGKWRHTMLGLTCWVCAGGSLRAVQKAFEGAAKWEDLAWIALALFLGTAFWAFFDLIKAHGAPLPQHQQEKA